ncbi:hypothetical protein C0991_009527 [Blastosporella zonata]|nr:hypothetical protein C0991_009527 [Blastosporella zonata]
MPPLPNMNAKPTYFTQIHNAYRLLLEDVSTVLNAPSSPPPPSSSPYQQHQNQLSYDRMRQSAAQGVQALDVIRLAAPARYATPAASYTQKSTS